MLEVYVDYVVCKQERRHAKATIHLSTERGERVVVNANVKDVTWAELMTMYLSKYSSGMYSKERNKIVPQCNVTEDMDGFEPYHLNYCPEYIEREFEVYDEVYSGYRFGSLNPLYGGKVNAILMDIMPFINKDDTFSAHIAFYDDNDSFLEVYSVITSKNVNRNQFVLDTLKQIATNYYYSVEDGYWDMYADGKTPTGTFYGINFNLDEELVLDLDFT